MKEYPVLFGSMHTLVGIVSYDESFTINRSNKTGILLLNAGLIHRIGPNRLYVKLARDLADFGFVVMRFDMSGVGDSQARTDGSPQEETVLEEARHAMDHLQHHRGVESFLLIGACAGASAAFLIAESDFRVRGAVLLNPLVPPSDHTVKMEAYQYYLGRALFRKASWLRLSTFKSDIKTIAKAIKFRFSRIFFPDYLKSVESFDVVNRLEKAFQNFLSRKMSLLIISSENEIGSHYLREILGKKFFEMLDTCLIKTAFLEQTDHNITPLKSQNQLIKIIPDWCRSVEECIFTK